MKKIWIILGLILLIYILCGFSYSPFSKYQEYIGKLVVIDTIKSCYAGRLRYIITTDTCGQKDGFGHCLYNIYYHTIELDMLGHTIWIPEEVIANITEIK